VVTFHVFPEQNKGQETDKELFNTNLYPDLLNHCYARCFESGAKKLMDILGSSFALLFLSPLMLIIAAAIKYTSDGPVFFKQERTIKRREARNCSF
jgi:lipopolysaccharide/colanic/teichoic acid biosynthesis glycosyltransferase